MGMKIMLPSPSKLPTSYSHFQVKARKVGASRKGVLDSPGCCNKISQTLWLKMTGVYFSTVLETRKGCDPSQGSRGKPASQWLLAPGVPGLKPHHYNLCLPGYLASFFPESFKAPCLSLIRSV